MSDITGITNLNSTSPGDTSLAGIKDAVGNLNTDKADSSTLTAHTSAVVNAHGISGSFVGSTDTQTLTNKTLTSPIIAGASVSGTFTPSSGTYGVSNANIVNSRISGALNTLTVRELDFSLSDNTTADVSTSKHGLVPKLPNSTTKFFRADGTYAVPAGGSNYPGTSVFNGTSPTSWTNLDISSVVGTGNHIAMLKIQQDGTASSVGFGFRQEGDSGSGITVPGASFSGANLAATLNASGPNFVYAWAITDSSGVIEWVSSSAQTTQIFVMFFM